MSSELGLVFVESLPGLACEATSLFIWLQSTLCPIQLLKGYTIILSPKYLVALGTLLWNDDHPEQRINERRALESKQNVRRWLGWRWVHNNGEQKYARIYMDISDDQKIPPVLVRKSYNDILYLTTS